MRFITTYRCNNSTRSPLYHYHIHAFSFRVVQKQNSTILKATADTTNKDKLFVERQDYYQRGSSATFRNQARRQILRFGRTKYIHRGQGFCFIICSKHIFLGSTQFWGDTSPECWPVATGLLEMKPTSPLGGIQQTTGAQEKTAKSATPCFYLRLVITSG